MPDRTAPQPWPASPQPPRRPAVSHPGESETERQEDSLARHLRHMHTHQLADDADNETPCGG